MLLFVCRKQDVIKPVQYSQYYVKQLILEWPFIYYCNNANWGFTRVRDESDKCKLFIQYSTVLWNATYAWAFILKCSTLAGNTMREITVVPPSFVLWIQSTGDGPRCTGRNSGRTEPNKTGQLIASKGTGVVFTSVFPRLNVERLKQTRQGSRGSKHEPNAPGRTHQAAVLKPDVLFR